MTNWIDIHNEADLNQLLETYGGFHDSCLKELRYVSGAYVRDNLWMHPFNDQRKLYLLMQRQSESNSVLELEFSGLVQMNLQPNDENYTCEILDVSMFLEDGKIWWGDSSWFQTEREKYDGTWLCAKQVRWRILENGLGNRELYESIKKE